MHDTEDGERALVVALRAGDESAFDALVRLHAGPMLAVARRILSLEEDARDAVQDAFISAFKSIRNFEGGARLSTWLHRIVVNSALMRLRSRRRNHETSIDELLPTFKHDGHATQPVSRWRDATAEVERREFAELVRRYIDELPEIYRTVLLLRDIEELSTEETAELLGIQNNAVKTRLHRARQALRALLDPHLREEPR